MKCSGCGASIPIKGTVCPHCQRDKTADKKVLQNVQAASRFSAALVASLLGRFRALQLEQSSPCSWIFRSKGTKPPEVVPVGLSVAVTSVGSDGDTSRQLTELESLRKSGMVSRSC